MEADVELFIDVLCDTGRSTTSR
nr:phage tail assembly chaperone [Escherichia coli]